MTNQLTQPGRMDEADARKLERTQRLFLLARAQLAAGRAEPLRLEAARRTWPSHRRRFG
jgi:hypothetical protein